MADCKKECEIRIEVKRVKSRNCLQLQINISAGRSEGIWRQLSQRNCQEDETVVAIARAYAVNPEIL